MKTKLKPVIMYRDDDGSFYSKQTTYGQPYGQAIEHLCIPLNRASRKSMIEAMAMELFNCDRASTLYEKAKAALSALEAMAKTP